MSDISQLFKEHYAQRLAQHGPTPAGVDWIREDAANLSYECALKLPNPRFHSGNGMPSLLDVGCGYGGLLSYARSNGLDFDYTGIDIVPDMLEHAKKLHPDARFICGDFLTFENIQRYDYVVCNGILTIKLESSALEMNRYFNAFVRKLFEVCNVGIAFNVMTSHVNFQSENSYYRSPVETLAFCLSELSEHVTVDHNHPRYQFWTYVYRQYVGQASRG